MSDPLLELLQQIQSAEEGADLTPIFEQLSTGIEGQAEALSERDRAIAEAQDSIRELKARNYELITQIPASEAPANSDAGAQEETPITIDDLFKKKGE